MKNPNCSTSKKYKEDRNEIIEIIHWLGLL